MTFSVLERSANVVLFMPLGLLLLATLGHRRWAAAFAIGVTYSVFIEACQALFLSGRVADPIGVVMNGLGTALGVMGGLAILGQRNSRWGGTADETADAVRRPAVTAEFMSVANYA